MCSDIYKILICIIYLTRVTSYRVSAVRGSQYYDPDVYLSHKYLFNIFRSVSNQYEYREYFLPVVDYYETFSRHLENSDSLMDVYKFEDKSGRLLALRPEITPQLCAMVNDQWSNYKKKPLRWFTIADCWRYERPCSGRRRNHQQWNLDLIASESPNMDAEPLLVLIHAFQSFGLTNQDIKICINSTDFIAKLLEIVANGSKIELSQFTRILDKYNRIIIDEFVQELKNIGFKTPECERLLEYLNVKESDLLLNIFTSDSIKSTLDVFKSLGLDKWISLDLSIARGNGYYSGLVYEAFDRKTRRRAIAGGGHYKMDVEKTGATVECSGFGMGNIVLFDLLSERKLIPGNVDFSNDESE